MQVFKFPALFSLRFLAIFFNIQHSLILQLNGIRPRVSRRKEPTGTNKRLILKRLALTLHSHEFMPTCPHPTVQHKAAPVAGLCIARGRRAQRTSGHPSKFPDSRIQTLFEINLHKGSLTFPSTAGLCGCITSDPALPNQVRDGQKSLKSTLQSKSAGRAHARFRCM